MRSLGGLFGLLALRGRTHDALAVRLFAAERRRYSRCFLAQVEQRVLPGIAGFRQSLQSPRALALRRFSWAKSQFITGVDSSGLGATATKRGATRREQPGETLIQGRLFDQATWSSH